MKLTIKRKLKGNASVSTQEIIDILLKIKQVKNMKEFLNPPHPEHLSLFDFGAKHKKQSKLVIEILEQIRREGKTVVVYSDYDADGITGGAILWETLHLLGFNAMPYVPHRKLEGYGFSIKGIDTIKKQYDPALIISVDHGITAQEKIRYAKSLGIPVVVTDHHLKPEHPPTDAVAIFHIPELSGSGVAYFFAKMIFDHFKETVPSSTSNHLSSNFKTDYLALAAIGTVADLVPLLGHARSIVKYGLESYTRTKRPGLMAIAEEAGIQNKVITPYEIGYIIAPRINAVGRLEHALDALRLLCTKDLKKARALAHRVGGMNQERQNMVSTAVEEAKTMINSLNPQTYNKLIILTSNTWHEGIIGLIASKIAEEYYRPTIVVTTGNGFLKGSARSIPALHMTDFLRSLKKDLIDVGGHKAAAGFTIEKKKLPSFISDAQKKVQRLIREEDLERTVELDMEIPLSSITITLARSLKSLEPFGIGNPKPTFISEVIITQARMFGKDNNHLKLFVQDKGKKSNILELIGFSMGKAFLSLEKETPVEIAYTLDIDRWNGNERLIGKIYLVNAGGKEYYRRI